MKVLELGGGTGILSYFAAQQGAFVRCVERNPELVRTARRLLSRNLASGSVRVIEEDAAEYMPPEPVDVVICEMLHVAMLREKQLDVIEQFKQGYTQKFGDKLPRFVPDSHSWQCSRLNMSSISRVTMHPFHCFKHPRPITIRRAAWRT